MVVHIVCSLNHNAGMGGLAEGDCCGWGLAAVGPLEDGTWRSGVGSAMRAASQLPRKGPTDVDDAPAPAR